MDPEPGVDFDRPNAARMYDYMLGGGANFAVDRDLVQQLLVVNPDARRVFAANRAFLGRVVRWCSQRGIDQFLDLGSGVPTVGNVHELAHRATSPRRGWLTSTSNRSRSRTPARCSSGWTP